MGEFSTVAQEARRISARIMEEFNKIYEENLWGDPESRSGMGSTVASTETLRSEVESLLLKYNIKSILDLGCGDNNWILVQT